MPPDSADGLGGSLIVTLLDRGMPSETASAAAALIDRAILEASATDIAGGISRALSERGAEPAVLSGVPMIVSGALAVPNMAWAAAGAPTTDTPAYTTRRIALALAGVAVSLLIAYGAQSLFEDATFRAILSGAPAGSAAGLTALNRMAMGVGLYCLAGVLFAFCALPLEVTLPAQLRAISGRSRIGRPNGLRIVLIALATAMYLGQLWVYRSDGETGLSRGLWFASLVAFAMTALQLPGDARRPVADAEHSPPFRPIHAGLLFALLAGTLAMRMVQLDENMVGINLDTGFIGTESRKFLLGNSVNLFRPGWGGIPNLAFAQEAIPMAVFGNNVFGNRMAGAIAGVTSVAAAYLVVWRLSDRHRMAFFAAGLLAVSAQHLFYSRLPTNTAPLANGLLCVFFMVDGMRAKRAGSFALAGICLGTAFQLYSSSRTLPFFLAPFLVGLLVTRRRWVLGNLPGFGLMALSTLTTLGTWILSDAETITRLTERTRDVLILEPKLRDYYQAVFQRPTLAGLMLEQVQRSVFAFNLYPDNSLVFKFPHTIFAASVSPLILLGIAYSARQALRPVYLFALLWWLVNMLFGSVLTDLPPTWQRLSAMSFGGAILGAIGLDASIATVERFVLARRQRHGAPARPTDASLPGWLRALGAAGVAALLIGNGAHSLRAVLDYGARYVQLEGAVGRAMYELPSTVTACGISNPINFQYIEVSFLAYPRVFIPFTPDAAAADLKGLTPTACVGRAVVWLLSPNHESLVEQIKARWPGGQMEQHRTPDGKPWFKSYLALQGVDLSAMTRQQAANAITYAVPVPPGIANYSSYTKAGLPFVPALTFLGRRDSVPYEIKAGRVTVAGGPFSLQVGALPAHSAVYDYVRLVDSSGREFRIEAEDERYTTGDRYAKTEGLDGHWWLQGYSGFGGGKGLVAVAGEVVPVLTTTVELPPGEYDVYVGSFTGGRNEGIFGLGLTIE